MLLTSIVVTRPRVLIALLALTSVATARGVEAQAARKHRAGSEGCEHTRRQYHEGMPVKGVASVGITKLAAEHFGAVGNFPRVKLRDDFALIHRILVVTETAGCC